MSSLAMSLSDTLVLAKRNLMRIPRQPDLLVSYTIQPVMFVLLFVYVFGGAMIPGRSTTSTSCCRASSFSRSRSAGL